jgi:hypothetical protein
MDVELTGWDGGTVMGAPNTVGDRQVHAADDLAFVHRMFYLFNQEYTWPSISEPRRCSCILKQPPVAAAAGV